MTDCREDTDEIEIKPDGSWRVKSSGQFKDLEKWHLPDGTLCSTSAVKPCFSLHAGSEIKQEMFMEADQGETKPSIQKLETENPKIGFVLGSSGLNGQGPHALEKEMEIELIVLSDSDDDNVVVLDPSVVNEPPIVNDRTGFTTGGPSCLELLTGGPDDFDLYWDYTQNYPQAGSQAGQQFFSEGQHQVQNGVTVALNGNGTGQDINSNGTSDHTDYWSSFNLQDRSDLMDLDTANRPGPSGNLTGENSAVQPIVDAGKNSPISHFFVFMCSRLAFIFSDLSVICNLDKLLSVGPGFMSSEVDQFILYPFGLILKVLLSFYFRRYFDTLVVFNIVSFI